MVFPITRFIPLILFPLFILSCATQKDAGTSSADTYAVYPDLPGPGHPGMWLLPQLSGSLLDTLQQSGFNLSEKAIYSAISPSLNDAIVRINTGEGGGGTGSFVSDQGLVLTNHHVAYDAIASASSPENNYLESGFYADDYENEIPIHNYNLYIPVEQVEVTGRIDSLLTPDSSSREKAQQKVQIESFIAERRSASDPDLTAEINDFWSGNRQYMSVYRVIRDVRLVYAPKSSIGKFGGDIDNWMWPRHTGDFTFLRAYTSPDGTSGTYQPQNIPYQPEKSLPLRISDVKPGDFTAVIGFPGTTHRFESSYAFNFYENQQFPALEKAFEAYYTGLQLEASQSDSADVATASERASIANTLKYIEGIQNGFTKYDATMHKKRIESEFSRWVHADSLRLDRYGRVLQQLEQSYDIAGQMGDVLYLSFYASEFSKVIQMAPLFDEVYEYQQNPDSIFFSMDDRQKIFDQVRLWQQSVNPETETVILTELLKAMAEFPEERRPLTFYRFFDSDETGSLQNEIESFIDRQKNRSVLFNQNIAEKWIYTDHSHENHSLADSLYLITRDIHERIAQSQQNFSQHFTYLVPAQKRYAEGMLKMINPANPYPDANFTLRFSRGEISGYSPADGIYNTPFTTFSGMLEKDQNSDPFDVPAELERYRSSVTSAAKPLFGEYANSSGNLTVNMLTSNDITGGNSGSPLLNGNGELIGLAFDGNYEGIISDYFYVADVARTINVDVRYMLFLMDEIDNTERLLQEMEIRKN